MGGGGDRAQSQTAWAPGKCPAHVWPREACTTLRRSQHAPREEGLTDSDPHLHRCLTEKFNNEKRNKDIQACENHPAEKAKEAPAEHRHRLGSPKSSRTTGVAGGLAFSAFRGILRYTRHGDLQMAAAPLSPSRVSGVCTSVLLMAALNRADMSVTLSGHHTLE